MLHLILTHHVTAPSPPISLQTREDTKESMVVCSLTLRYALAPAIGHRHAHPQSEALTLPGPGTVMRADSWYALPRPSTARRKPLPYSHFDTAHLPGPQPSAKETFFPLPKSSHTGIVRRSSRAPNKGLFVTIFAPGLLTQFLAFSCPSATQSSPSRKAIKTTISLRPRARAASKEAGRKQPPRLPIPPPVSQAADRAASCQPGKRAAAALLPSPSRENFGAAL